MNLRRLALALPLLRQLGLRPLALYACYRLGLWTGHYRRTTAGGRASFDSRPQIAMGKLAPAVGLPSREALASILGDQFSVLLGEAGEIAAGKVRLFGAHPVPLQLAVPGPLEHWTAYERGRRVHHDAAWAPPEAVDDVKFTWEPGRFGWAHTLARAYYLSGEERFARAFWAHAETFLDANPPGQGPHWVSAQEVALRLIALVFAGQVFAVSGHSTPPRMSRLAQAVAEHAGRIPPTLVYALSQDNNHLLVEAAGLYTAGVFLADHPSAPAWRRLGRRWLLRGLRSQIAPDGAYTQNSANYHRLMLQIALWACRVASVYGEPFPQDAIERLASATLWLTALVDPASGQAPNLGPNDGAYIFPWTVCPFADYRPVLQAAGQAFLGERPFPAGVWDEMGLWLGLADSHPVDDGRPATAEKNTRPDPQRGGGAGRQRSYPASPHVLRSPSGASWATLRVARHTARPGHADQLHLDLWWRGLNVARDPGTYLYNGRAPWENSLAGTLVHNTVAVDGWDQMTRLGRFLWLDWAQGQVLSADRAPDGSYRQILASQDGYRRLGLLHQRQVAAVANDRWVIEDRLDHMKPSTFNMKHVVRLHWLLPDWPWEMARAREEDRDPRVEIRIQSPYGWVTLRVALRTLPGNATTIDSPFSALLPQLVRAGEVLSGPDPSSPTWGWFSPTYGQKLPALSFSVTIRRALPLTLVSEWTFPGE